MDVTQLFRAATWTALALAAAATPAHAETPAPPPRYHLNVGQQLDYETTIVTHPRGTADAVHKELFRFQFAIAATTPDGGWHVVEVFQFPPTHTWGASNVPVAPTLAEFDLSPDGRAAIDPMLRTVSPDQFFPALPPDPLTKRWPQLSPPDGMTYELVASTPPAIRQIDSKSPDDPATFFQFDPARGLMTASSWNGSYRLTAQTSEMRLVHNGQHPPAWAHDLARQATLLLGAHQHYFQQLSEGGTGANQDPASYEADALDDLKMLRPQITDPLLSKVLAGWIAEHPIRTQGFSDLRRTSLAGQPAPLWTLSDLAAKPHSLAAQKGKIAVLVFFTRGSSTCAAALPQLDKLAATLANKAVEFIAIDLDASPIDARAAAAQWKLHMPTLLGGASDARGEAIRKLCDDYNLVRLPGIVVVGPDAKVAESFIGYDPTAADALNGQIDALLAQ